MAKRKSSSSLTRNRLLVEFLRKSQLEAMRLKVEEETNRDRSVLLESGLFDEHWYLKAYRDVAAAGLDPVIHYLKHGASERRDPGPHFSTADYLAKNPGLDPAVCNPLYHFIKEGDYRTSQEARTLAAKRREMQMVRTALSESGLFDAAWYLENNPDVSGANIDPLEHYILYGAAELRRAGPHFDTRFYVQSYRDVAAAGVNPLYHFVKFGKAESRIAVSPLEVTEVVQLLRASGQFNADWYLAQNPDVEKAGMDPIEHYVRHGAREGRYPNPNFMTKFYATQMNAQEQACFNPLEHYILIGEDQGLLTSPQHLRIAPAFPAGTLLDTAVPFSPGTIAIMAHVFHPEMCGDFASWLRNMPVAFDLLVSTDTLEKKTTIETAFANLPRMAKLDVRVTPNRGRDIAPMFTEFAEECLAHDFVLHIHSKRSPYGREFAKYFEYCMQHVLHSPLYVDSLLRHFAANPRLGAIFPPIFPPVARHMHWSRMRSSANQVMKRIGLPAALIDAFPLVFPAGSMLWFRPAAFKAIFEAGFKAEEFPLEEGQINDALQHLLERLFFYVAHHHGFGHQTARPASARENFRPRLLAAPSRPIHIPVTDAPVVSIVVPVFNHWDLTAACLFSVVAHTDALRTPYEIVLADDGSIDATCEAELAFPGLHRVRTPRNLGFVGNCNNASAHCRGKFILFLNNDTQVQPGWLDAMLEVFATRADAAVVGCKLVFPDGSLQEAGGVVWRNAHSANYGRNQDPAQPPYCYVKECDYVSGAALMVDASFFRSCGGFDAAFGPAYYEDTDLCFQARAAGRKVYFQPASIVVHLEGQSHGTDTSKGIKRHIVINRKRFRQKWAKELAANHFDGRRLPRTRERSQGKTVIAIFDYLLPEFDRHAMGRYTFSYMRLLLERGYVLKYFCSMLEDERQFAFAHKLEQMGVETFHPGTIDVIHNWSPWIDENASNIDAFWLNHRLIASLHINACVKSGKPIIFFCHDLNTLRERREAELAGDMQRASDIQAQEKFEIDLFRAADVAYTPSSYEAAYLRETHGLDNVIVNPVFMFDTSPALRLTAPTGEDIVFVGLLRHRPNLDGISWFLSQIWPDVAMRHPRARLHIVGDGVPAEIAALAGARIIVHGGVDDNTLAGIYATARLAIVPVRYGAGVKGKLIEAFQHRLPVVSTGIGLEGVAGVERLLAARDTPADFANAVSVLLDADNDTWLAAANGLARFGYENFSKEAGWESLRQGLSRIGLSM